MYDAWLKNRKNYSLLYKWDGWSNDGYDLFDVRLKNLLIFALGPYKPLLDITVTKQTLSQSEIYSQPGLIVWHETHESLSHYKPSQCDVQELTKTRARAGHWWDIGGTQAALCCLLDWACAVSVFLPSNQMTQESLKYRFEMNYDTITIHDV